MSALISTIIAWFKSLFSGGSEPPKRREQTTKNVMPRELIARVLEECDSHAMEYSDTKRQLPCTFSIFLSEEDFDFFYRANREEVEGEIADGLRKYAQQTGDLMKVPSVTLRIDTDLSKGEYRVVTSFDANVVPPTPPYKAPVEAQVQPQQQDLDIPPLYGPPPVDVVSQQKSVARVVEVQENPEDTPPVDDVKTMPGVIGIETPPIVVQPSYQVVATDGTVYSLDDGDVVGLLRRADREQPDIILRPTTDLEYCSQRHGEFVRCTDGGFAYRNLSGNGSIVMRGEKVVRLMPGDDPVVLESGDQIVLGKGNPALTYQVA